MSTRRTVVFSGNDSSTLIDDAKRIVRRRHKHSPHQIDDGDLRPVNFTSPETTAGGIRRIVCGANETRLFADVIDRFLLVEDVIAGGHDVDAVGKQLLAKCRRDGEAAGEVFGIHDREIDVVLFAQILNTLEHRHTPGLRDHISDHQHFHLV